MSQLLAPRYLVITGILLALFVAWRLFLGPLWHRLWGRLRPKSKSVAASASQQVAPVGAETHIGKTVQAIVFDNMTRTFNPNHLEDIGWDDVEKMRKKYGNLGRITSDENDRNPCYSLVRTVEGEYEPMLVPEDSEFPPSKLYRVFQLPLLTRFTHNLDTKESIMQKYGAVIWISVLAIGAVALVMLNK